MSTHRWLHVPGDYVIVQMLQKIPQFYPCKHDYDLMSPRINIFVLAVQFLKRLEDQRRTSPIYSNHKNTECRGGPDKLPTQKFLFWVV